MKNAMLMNKVGSIILAAALAALSISCVNVKELDGRLDELDVKIETLTSKLSELNASTIKLSKLVNGSTLITSFVKTDAGYELSLSDGSVMTVHYGATSPLCIPTLVVDDKGFWQYSFDDKVFNYVEGADNVHVGDCNVPQFSIDEKLFWTISIDGGKTWTRLTDETGKPLSADPVVASGYGGPILDVVYDDEASLMRLTLKNGTIVDVPVAVDFSLNIVGLNADESFYLGETREYEVKSVGVKDIIVDASQGWKVVFSDGKCAISSPSSGAAGIVSISVLAVSDKGLLMNRAFSVNLIAKALSEAGCQTWRDFDSGSASNLLLDFSYAGYDHGETAPGDVNSFGWRTIDVTKYGAKPDDGLSDRAAFEQAVADALGGKASNADAKAVIYFPAGEYILHTADDDTDGKTNTLTIRAGNIVLKGAGRDKTTLVMKDPALPTDENVLYSSPSMLEFKHQSGLSKLADVTSDAPKGSFSVSVSAGAESIKAGDFVCLHLLNNNPELIAEELAPYTLESGMKDLSEDGVKVFDYHQVKSVENGVITFCEPIMRKVDAKWGWTIQKYPHYENVGIEDLSFKGFSKDDFEHHGSWEDDGAYKPVNMIRITNGWMRRVGFIDVSEACSVTNCANISVYDVTIEGNRGHSSIRSQQSSRVFIGKVRETSGSGAGQYHAVGVSKPSMGTVLWRNEWGNDSCFESHATQPRATLIDCCKGGWMYFRQGGDEAQVPNHLADLTIWNFESITPFADTWIWWNASSKWWKFLPPVIVGFHGSSCNFDQSQLLVDEAHGEIVAPQSLYEAQLSRRLGYVPSWLNALK